METVVHFGDDKKRNGRIRSTTQRDWAAPSKHLPTQARLRFEQEGKSCHTSSRDVKISPTLSSYCHWLHQPAVPLFQQFLHTSHKSCLLFSHFLCTSWEENSTEWAFLKTYSECHPVSTVKINIRTESSPFKCKWLSSVYSVHDYSCFSPLLQAFLWEQTRLWMAGSTCEYGDRERKTDYLDIFWFDAYLSLSRSTFSQRWPCMRSPALCRGSVSCKGSLWFENKEFW